MPSAVHRAPVITALRDEQDYGKKCRTMLREPPPVKHVPPTVRGSCPVATAPAHHGLLPHPRRRFRPNAAVTAWSAP